MGQLEESVNAFDGLLQAMTELDARPLSETQGFRRDPHADIANRYDSGLGWRTTARRLVRRPFRASGECDGNHACDDEWGVPLGDGEAHAPIVVFWVRDSPRYEAFIAP
jgi:hypothetical protein